MVADRELVLKEQSAKVKRALATAAEQSRTDNRRHRAATILILLLLGGCWRFLTPMGVGSSSTSPISHTLPSGVLPLPRQNATGG